MLNNVTFMGRLADDPVLRYTHTNSIPVASFSLAVNRPISKDKEPAADFFKVVAWRGTAEFVSKYFTQGQPICINGRLRQTKWTDEATGTIRYGVEVIADSVYFAGYKKEDSQTADMHEDNFDPFDEEAAAA